ncbi:hypothetical protein phytr_7510 [Candidatus Phycorickettsia trachydisci]|uniref:Uncharacterized protein n=1 Tax=Candidatus Phycorickettsia trachydisci TaxID=2115978 RepID=A0A2P1P8T4_9RICK|nr:hypothetical protein [Candidatus Phycorickettsia trachydisci]AVP87688.1 hypothetical protein phytr_7510 [Candidatus Phycorickettsia trachydisci]
MSVNTKSTLKVQIGHLLSEALTKKAIEIPVNLAATAITNYFNLGGKIASPDAYYITADRIDNFTNGTISILTGVLAHVTVKDYVKSTFDYLLSPVFGYKHSDLGESLDFVREKSLESHDIIKEDMDLVGAESIPAY